MPTHADIARAACRAFLEDECQIEPVAHGETATFRVRANDTYLLRVHAPQRASADEAFHTEEALESELAWLEALGRDTEIAIQRPVTSPRGERVVTVRAASGASVRCTMLTWLDGEILEERPSSAQAVATGRLLATMHEHARDWARPEKFTRPEHKPESILASIEALRRTSVTTDENLALLEQAAALAARTSRELSEEPEHWGLVHADLHDGNTLFVGDAPRPIDFGRCGFGHWLYDVAEAMLHRLPDGRAAFLDGYAAIATMPHDHVRYIEGFFLIGAMQGLPHQFERGDGADVVARSSNYIAQKLARAYLDGDSFLLPE